MVAVAALLLGVVVATILLAVPLLVPVRVGGRELVATLTLPRDLPGWPKQGLSARDYDRTDPGGYEVGSGWSLTVGRWRYNWALYEHRLRREW